MKNIFSTFVYCRNMLGRLLPHDLKTFNFLPVRLLVQISAKARKPYQALYSNRQVRNEYNVFIHLAPSIRHSRLYNNGMKRNYTPISLLAPVTEVFNSGSRNGLFLPLDRSDRANDRQLGFKKQNSPLFNWGRGLFLSFSQKLHSL